MYKEIPAGILFFLIILSGCSSNPPLIKAAQALPSPVQQGAPHKTAPSPSSTEPFYPESYAQPTPDPNCASDSRCKYYVDDERLVQLQIPVDRPKIKNFRVVCKPGENPNLRTSDDSLSAMLQFVCEDTAVYFFPPAIQLKLMEAFKPHSNELVVTMETVL